MLKATVGPMSLNPSDAERIEVIQQECIKAKVSLSQPPSSPPPPPVDWNTGREVAGKLWRGWLGQEHGIITEAAHVAQVPRDSRGRRRHFGRRGVGGARVGTDADHVDSSPAVTPDATDGQRRFSRHFDRQTATQRGAVAVWALTTC